MDPSKSTLDPPRSIDNNANPAAMGTPQCDISDSLNRLSLANATAIPLPKSPSLLSPDAPSHPPHPNQPAPRRSPSSNSLRNERRKSIPALQKRSSTASLRSSSGNNGPSSPRADASRRSSANLAGSPTSGTSVASPTNMSLRLKLGPPPEAQELTAASIAAQHFRRENDLHQAVDLKCKTVVVLHDACYGHRFSRPDTTAEYLKDIVERPERIRACILGVANAYVRLGERYAGGRFAPHPNLEIDLLPPPFQISKSSRLLPLHHEAVTTVHGTSWMTELQSMCEHAESRLISSGQELVRNRVRAKLPMGDLYLCAESQDAFEGALGAVCDAIDTVFRPGPTDRAFVCIRPPGHHCSASDPSGFCWVNNVHVGISYAASQHGLTHAAILDFDLHHGDGSQDIAWKHNDKVFEASRRSSAYEKAPIGYYSLHDINSYPCEPKNTTPENVRNASVCIDGAHGQYIWNVHLETWETETDFWNLYRTKYNTLINKARDFLRHHAEKLAKSPNGPRPKAAIFISAGFDASQWESKGMQRHQRNVPTGFYAQFTADVVQMAQEEGLGVDGRVISVLEGGYSDRALTSGVLSHLCGLTSTSEGIPSPDQPDAPAPGRRNDWWSPRNLDELEPLLASSTKSREKSTSTFLSSTRSSSAKVVAPPRERKTSSSYLGLDPIPSNLPEVGWATASHEAFKALIPGSRETTSHAPEYLGIAASRQRRQAARDGSSMNPDTVRPPPPTPADGKRTLRTRKAKSPTPYSPRPATPRQQAMRKNRRKTLDSNEVVPDDSRESSPSVDARRRKSTTAVAPVATDDTDASKNPNILSMDGSGSVQSSRPTSTNNSRKTSPDTPRKSSATRKAPPVPKVPNTFLPSKLSDQVARPEDDDLENLSNGFQKIKLVMPSPEEQAAREKKANEARKQTAKGAKTPKSPATRKTTTSTKTARGKTALRPESLPTSSPPALPTPPIGVSASDATVKQENQPFNFGLSSDTLVASSPMMPPANPAGPSAQGMMFPVANPSEWATQTVSPAASQQPASFADNSPPHTPGNDLDMAISTPQSNVFSPPTSEGHTKTGLPVFTSSSAIPFAASDTSSERPPQDQPHPQSNYGSNYPSM